MLEENVQAKEESLSAEVALNSPRTSKETWLKVRVDYESGNYKTLKELGKRYGITHQSIRGKVFREKWIVKQRTLQHKVEQRAETNMLKEVDRQSEYLSNAFLRAKKYERMLDASVSQLATTPEGVPQCEPADLDSLSRTELRIHELAKSSLRIPVAASIDLKSGGQSIGESIVSAIAKLRETNSAVSISSEQVDRVLDMEVIE